ncbi:hypothetical protein EDB19DRAFT_1905246 [Suillus lakei]|nr:hypothetical protein EDB19DRAFT_1905246 [Suillus lakei]
MITTIVGGVLGGIAAIALLGLLFRAVAPPQVDLSEDNEVTPSPYSSHGGSIRQYGESPLPRCYTMFSLSSPSQHLDIATEAEQFPATATRSFSHHPVVIPSPSLH